MEMQSPDNHGEGDPEAAERFNSAGTRFVNSAQGRRRIQDGAQVRPNEEAELVRAEQLGRARSKGDDSTCLDGL